MSETFELARIKEKVPAILQPAAALRVGGLCPDAAAVLVAGFYRGI